MGEIISKFNMTAMPSMTKMSTNSKYSNIVKFLYLLNFKLKMAEI